MGNVIDVAQELLDKPWRRGWPYGQRSYLIYLVSLKGNKSW